MHAQGGDRDQINRRAPAARGSRKAYLEAKGFQNRSKETINIYGKK